MAFFFLLNTIIGDLLFDTIEEAIDLNSNCAFCDKMKFRVSITRVLDDEKYGLIRCDDKRCSKHCNWDHDYIVLQLDLGGPDAVSIASGW